MKIRKPSLIQDWKRHIKSYSALSLFANVLIALAYGISVAFSMGIVSLSPIYIILAMGTVACLGSVGRFIKQIEDTNEEA